MSDNATRRRGRLTEAFLHKWSDDRARELRKDKQRQTQAKAKTPKPKGP